MVKVYCQYFGESSFSRHARFFLRALDNIEPVALFASDHTGGFTNPPETIQMLENQYLANTDHYSLGIGPIGRMTELPEGKRIAFIVWETTRLPQNERRVLKTMDYIWVPSKWGKSILIDNGFAENRVHVIPEGADTNLFRPLPKAHNKSGKFRFLCVGKWEKRKGIADLITAFLETFKPNEEVELVLHSHKTSIRGFDLRANLKSLNLPTRPRISASLPMPENDLPFLYNNCDAFVLPTKGEGWGLPIIEAMACGLPVIVTNYSAPTEFVNTENGYLVHVAHMAKATDRFAFNCPGTDYGCWAQPNVAHLKFLMRYVFEHQEEAKVKGARGHTDVMDQWTWDHAAQKAASCLHSLE